MKEHRLIMTKDGEKHVEGYFFTVDELSFLLESFSYAKDSYSARKGIDTVKYIESYEKHINKEK